MRVRAPRGRIEVLAMEVVTLTNPGAASIAQTILGGVRDTLTDVDEAILAVAFVQVAGVNFLEKQLRPLGSSTRLVVTACSA